MMRTTDKITFFFAFETVIALSIILTVLTVLIYEVDENRTVSRTTANIGEAISYKPAIMAHYALTGDWPKDDKDISHFLPNINASLANFHIEDGALQIASLNAENFIVTLHPAVQEEDPLGPVKWVAGNKDSAGGWKLIGKDKTTIEPRYIMNELK